MLLVDNDVAKEVVEVNSLNERGMSPLDESEAGDRFRISHNPAERRSQGQYTEVDHASNIGESAAPLDLEIIHQVIPPTKTTIVLKV